MIPVTREIYDLVSYGKWLGNESIRKEKWRPGRDESVSDMKWMERETPPGSIEDRTVVGSVDQV